MKQTPYVYFLWVTVTLLQAGIAIAMYRRKQHREFPAFWWYTVFHVVQSITAFVASSTSYTVFFYVYWGTEAIDAIFTLVVLQEIFSKVFDPYSSLRNIGSVLFRWLAILLCLFAVVSAAVAPGVAADRFIRGLLAMERSIQLIQTGYCCSFSSSANCLGSPGDTISSGWPSDLEFTPPFHSSPRPLKLSSESLCLLSAATCSRPPMRWGLTSGPATFYTRRIPIRYLRFLLPANYINGTRRWLGC